MSSEGFESSIPAIERLQTCALDRLVTGYFTRNTYCVWKVMPPYLFTSGWAIEMQPNTKFSSYLTFPRSFRHNAASAEIVFRTRRVEFCTIFSKPFSLSSFNFITRETNWIEMFPRNTNNQTSDGAKTGLQGGCGTTSNPIRSFDAPIKALALELL